MKKSVRGMYSYLNFTNNQISGHEMQKSSTFMKIAIDRIDDSEPIVQAVEMQL